MKVVLDSNVLFRILISQGNILELLFDNNLKIYAPIKLKKEFFKNKEEIMMKSKLLEEDFEELSLLLFKRINFVQEIEYFPSIAEAKELLKELRKEIGKEIRITFK